MPYITNMLCHSTVLPFYLRYWLNICEGVHSDLQPEMCPDTAAACRKTSSGTIDTLGLISTQNLRMDSKNFYQHRPVARKFLEGGSAWREGVYGPNFPYFNFKSCIE